MSGDIEVWRGAVNAWDLDEMGHMNVRFYLARALDGLAGLSAELGLPDPYQPSVSSMLKPKEHHVRFLKEAHAGAPLHVEARVIEVRSDEMTIVQILRHSHSGEPCAAMTSRCAHTTLDGRVFPWSPRTIAMAQDLTGTPHEVSLPRGVSAELGLGDATLAKAEALGMPVTGRGVIGRRDCDAFGRMRSDAVMARFSDAATHLFGQGARALAAHSGRRIGGALLELRMRHVKTPRVGARYVLRSAIWKLEPKLTHIVHWLLDPETGEVLTAARGVAGSLDLEARKLVERTPEQLKLFEPMLVQGLEV